MYAEILVRFRREATGAIIQEEKRTIVMVPVPDEPGVMQPDLRSQSQVGQPALCPDYEHEDVVGKELILEVEIRPLYVEPSVKAVGTRRVVPTCDRADDQSQCRCECSADYVLGRCSGGPLPIDHRPTAGPTEALRMCHGLTHSPCVASRRAEFPLFCSAACTLLNGDACETSPAFTSRCWRSPR